MPKRRIIYGNGIRGCFLTLIKWPILLIGTGIVCLILHAILKTLYPKAEPLLLVFLASFGGVVLIRILAYSIKIFLAHATANDESGIVSLERGLRRTGHGAADDKNNTVNR